MRAVVYRAPRQFAVEQAEMPTIGPDDVLIRVQYCGVCHTDVNVHEGEFYAEFPLIPGHEIVGRVEHLGAGTDGTLKAGELVVADNTWTCGYCHYCRRGNPLFCEHFRSLGINGPGGQAEFIRVPASKVFSVEGRLSPEQAVFVEPLACAVAGREQARLRPGDSVLIYGAGSSALLLGQLLRTGGASRVVVAAPPSPKLDYARDRWADRVVAISRNEPARADGELAHLAPHGFELVVDCTGSPAVQTHALDWVAPNGMLLIYGMARFGAHVSWDPYTIFRKQLTIQGSFAQIFHFPQAIEALAARRVQVDDAITRVVGLEDYGVALQAVEHGEGIKTVVSPTA